MKKKTGNEQMNEALREGRVQAEQVEDDQVKDEEGTPTPSMNTLLREASGREE